MAVCANIMMVQAFLSELFLSRTAEEHGGHIENVLSYTEPEYQIQFIKRALGLHESQRIERPSHLEWLIRQDVICKFTLRHRKD